MQDRLRTRDFWIILGVLMCFSLVCFLGAQESVWYRGKPYVAIMFETGSSLGDSMFLLAAAQGIVSLRKKHSVCVYNWKGRERKSLNRGIVPIQWDSMEEEKAADTNKPLITRHIHINFTVDPCPYTLSYFWNYERVSLPAKVYWPIRPVTKTTIWLSGAFSYKYFKHLPTPFFVPKAQVPLPPEINTVIYASRAVAPLFWKRALDHLAQVEGRNGSALLCCNDLLWAQEAIHALKLQAQLKLVEVKDPGIHLALMAQAPNVVVSGGSLGWWGAFLSHGRKVYPLSTANGDYYPPTWTGLPFTSDETPLLQ